MDGARLPARAKGNVYYQSFAARVKSYLFKTSPCLEGAGRLEELQVLYEVLYEAAVKFISTIVSIWKRQPESEFLRQTMASRRHYRDSGLCGAMQAGSIMNFKPWISVEETV
jgi:hypothetical protein